MQVRDSCDPGGLPDDSLRAVYQTVSSLSSALLGVSLRVSASYLYFLAFAFFVILFFIFIFLLLNVFTVCVCVVCFMLSPELCRADVCGTRSSMLAGLSCTKGVWYIYDWDNGSTILIW